MSTAATSDRTQLSAHKQLVHRLVDEVVNRRRFDLLDQLATERLAPRLRTAFEQFLTAFPDWHQEIVELIEEDDTVVARFRCTGTQARAWQGLSPTGRAMDIAEIAIIRMTGDRMSRMWGLEDTWTRMRQLAGDDVQLGELGSLSPPERRCTEPA